MSKSIYIQSGILTLAESKVICPHCKRSIPFDEIESKYNKTDKAYMKFKCKCKGVMIITMNILGDFVTVELNQKVK